MGAPDIVEYSPSRGRTAVVLLAVGCAAVGVALGYQLGHRSPDRPAVTPSPGVLTGTGKLCAIEVGARLQLGVEVSNPSTVELTLQRVDADLPLGGLRPVGTAWGTCGQVPPAKLASSDPLPPGGSTWLTMTFDVLDPCPAPYPVQFSVTYTQIPGGTSVARVGGYADLGDVPYSRCKSSPS